MEKDDPCYGCLALKLWENECPIKKKKRVKDCPCSICILKVICQPACEAYRKLCRELQD